MPRIYAYHFNDPTNLGDLVCCPVDYFESLRCAEKIDWQCDPEKFADAPVIIGGGGLLNPAMSERLERVVLRRTAPSVLWGVGTNVHRETKASYPNYLGHAGLVGLRDFGNPFEYVPCPSCLHPAFGGKFPVHHDFVIYEHSHHTIGIEPSAPRMANNEPKERMEAVLRFLASGDLVITNTYHGCFWAMLLSRRVLVYRPFSSRFFYFKPKVVFCDGDNWRAKAKETIRTIGYLEECRAINTRFAARVLEFLKIE